MEENVKRRITELEQAERDTTIQLMAIRTVLTELRALRSLATPTITGVAIGTPQEGEEAL